MPTFKDVPLLVTGASGHLGRIAVEELLARGATNVIAGTRDPSRLADLAARGVDVRKVDFNDADTLTAAFTGVERLLLVSTDGIGMRIAQQTAAINAAKAAGVKHVVYTSAPAARPNADAGLGGEHFWTEVALASSDLGFTILRNHMYAENTLADAAQVTASGQLFGLIGDRGTAYVTRADAARTAAGALLQASGNTVEDVTGPETITNVDRATLFTQLTGKPVAAIPLEPAALKAGMIGAGVPEGFAEALVAFQRDAASGYHSVVTDAVERYSGRKAQSLESFLANNRAALGA
jgi:NAD(P)H dehydrogenase (quinone)